MPDDTPRLPDGLLERALSGPSDPRTNPALLELIRLTLPFAMSLIRAALDERVPRRTKAPTTGQMRELFQAQEVPRPDDDPTQDDIEASAEIARRADEAIAHATEAALLSAAESFHAHGSSEFAEARTLDELALHLIRIAYNRYQKRRRRNTRLGRQAASGNGSLPEGRFLESRPDPRENPTADAELKDFLEIQRCLTDGILDGFSVRDRGIVLLDKAGFDPEAIVSVMNRRGRQRKPCTLNTVIHVLETFQAQLERVAATEDQDEDS